MRPHDPREPRSSVPSLSRRAFGRTRPLSIFTAVALAAISALATSDAAGQAGRSRSPYDKEQAALARAAESLGRSPRAVLPILRMRGYDDWSSPVRMARLYEQLSKSRRLSAQTRAYAAAMHALTRIRTGEPERATRLFDELGYVRRFRIVGPFDNEGKTGFDRRLPPEEAQEHPVDPEATYDGRERPVRYREYPDITRFGYVDFDATMRPYVNVCGFAETFVQAGSARPISLWTGAGGAVKVYWNGELVHTDGR
ncbi:MAG: hypothetical protein H5U40_12880, partial [Polyangiaceae bacterium]|nr:hypothetical protein [Polyangiaceae bacterium]